MTALITSRPSLRSTPLPRSHHRAALAAVVVLLVAVSAGALWDPSGLLAPVGGRGLPLAGAGGVYRWAALVVGLPILLAGTALPVLMTARPGRPAVSAWRVFTMTWIAAVGAAALAATVTGVAAAAPLWGPHLSPGLTIRFAAATSGFAAMKFLLVGPLAATAAALAFRTGPRPPMVDDGPVPPAAATITAILITAGVVTFAAVGFGSTWWRGGPVGYAFAGPLVAPSDATGVLGFLAGTAVFLIGFGLTVRDAHRRPVGEPTAPAVALTVWLAAIFAGFCLGVLDAAVAALPVSASLADAGPDDWWIATTLISVATGIGYGAAVGVIAATVTGLLWRLRSALRDHPARRRSARPMVGIVLVALASVLASPVESRPEPITPVQAAASGGMERLQLLPATVDGGLPAIGDVTGRQVILRGVNVNQLIDYYLRDPAKPATQPLTDSDFAQMAAMGFNVVRLGMSWSRLEPRRGVFDQAYLGQITAAVASAKAHGMYTVLDMHSDAWGNALARPGEQCGGGTTPTTGWDGAPEWATITDGTLHCQFMARDLAPAVAAAYGNFYTDRAGIQRELVRTWAFVAAVFADEPAVAGYDLFNEPGVGADPPISSGLLLGRYYAAAIAGIRDAEQAGGGYPHLAFFEPSVLWSGLAFDVTPLPGFTDDRQLVFAPHPYSESITMDQSLGLTIASIERNLTVSSRAAASYGAALWTGEWGWFGDPAVDGAKVTRFGAAQDRLGIGGAFWVWRQGCGSPETGPDATRSGNLVGIDCATGATIAPPTGFAQPLSRAYPRAFPGRLDRLVSDGARRELVFAATAEAGAVNCRIDVWVPGDAAPHLSTEGVREPAVVKVPGGWQITGCATGDYTVTVTP